MKKKKALRMSAALDAGLWPLPIAALVLSPPAAAWIETKEN